ncbi:MAG: Uma2 family endonuclease [Ardenticatenaceae bacterium]|nr:Uma2 family endonuclease [Ardenticatenaceae bacterium]
MGIPVEYPESDGEPLAESDFQITWIVYLLNVLSYFFRQRDDVYVAGNLLIYYEEGYPPSSVAPDVFVIFGVSNHKRKTYKIWEEGQAPHFILEVLSPTTVLKDRGDKKGLYEFLGVQEYFLFDPVGNLISSPPLQGYQLVEGIYQPISSTTLPNDDITLTSHVLDLELHTKNGELRLFNPQTQQYLLTYGEAESARAEAETRIAELEARLRALGEDI